MHVLYTWCKTGWEKVLSAHMEGKGCEAMWLLTGHHHFGMTISFRIILCSCLTEIWIGEGRSCQKCLLTWNAYTQSPLLLLLLHTSVLFEKMSFAFLLCCVSWFAVSWVCWIIDSFHEGMVSKGTHAVMLLHFFLELAFLGTGWGEAWRSWSWAEYVLYLWHAWWILFAPCTLTNCLFD